MNAHRHPLDAITDSMTLAEAGAMVTGFPFRMEAARQMIVDEVRASVLRLSLPEQLAIVRGIAMQHSEYAGSDDLVAGAESMAEDFRMDTLAHDGPAYFESERQVWS